MNEFAEYVLNVAKRIQTDVDEVAKPPPEVPKSKEDQIVIDFNLVEDTRGYIERTVRQINGAYKNEWYDACAVMLRRLIEILIHEVFEKHDTASKIKDNNNKLLPLSDLVNMVCDDYNLDGDSEKTLRALREIGNWSAHKRRYYTYRDDIKKHLPNIRVTVQELIYLAELKK